MTKEEFLKRWSNELKRREGVYRSRQQEARGTRIYDGLNKQPPSFQIFSRGLGIAELECERNIAEEDRVAVKKEAKAMMFDKLSEMGITLTQDDQEELKQFIKSDPKNIFYINLIRNEFDRRFFLQEILQEEPSLLSGFTSEQLKKTFSNRELEFLVRQNPQLVNYSPLPEMMKSDPELADMVNYRLDVEKARNEYEERNAKIKNLEDDVTNLEQKLLKAKEDLQREKDRGGYVQSTIGD